MQKVARKVNKKLRPATTWWGKRTRDRECISIRIKCQMSEELTRMSLAPLRPTHPKLIKPLFLRIVFNRKRVYVCMSTYILVWPTSVHNHWHVQCRCSYVFLCVSHRGPFLYLSYYFFYLSLLFIFIYYHYFFVFFFSLF